MARTAFVPPQVCHTVASDLLQMLVAAHHVLLCSAAKGNPDAPPGLDDADTNLNELFKAGLVDFGEDGK